MSSPRPAASICWLPAWAASRRSKRRFLQGPGASRSSRRTSIAKEVTVGDGELRRRYIVCYNPVRRRGNESTGNRLSKKLSKSSTKHPDHTATARWAIDTSGLGSLQALSHHRQEGSHPSGSRGVARWPNSMANGCFRPTTTPSPMEDAAAGYKGLLVIERASGRSSEPGSRWNRCTTGCPTALRPM